MINKTIKSWCLMILLTSGIVSVIACQPIQTAKVSEPRLDQGKISFSVQIPKGVRSSFIFDCSTKQMWRAGSSERLVFDTWVKGQIYNEYKQVGIQEEQALHHATQKTNALLKEINAMLTRRCNNI